MIWFGASVNQIFFYTCFHFKIQDWSRIGGGRDMLSPRGQAKKKDAARFNLGLDLGGISWKLKVYHAARTFFLRLEGWNMNVQ